MMKKYMTESSNWRIINSKTMLYGLVSILGIIVGVMLTLGISGVTLECSWFFLAVGLLSIPMFIVLWLLIKAMQRQMKIEKEEDDKRNMEERIEPRDLN